MSLSLLPEKPTQKVPERMGHRIGGAFLQLHERDLAWLNLQRRRTVMTQAIGSAHSAVEAAEFDLQRFRREPRSGWSTQEREARIIELEGAVTAQKERQHALITQFADLDAEIAENERTKAEHGRYVEKIEKHLNEKLRNPELLAAVAALKAQLAGGKVNGVTSGKPLSRADPVGAKLNELRGTAAAIRSDIAAVENDPLPAGDVREIVAHVFAKVKRSSIEAQRLMGVLRAPNARYRMPDPDGLAMVVWESMAATIGEEAMIDQVARHIDSSGKPGGLPLSERRAHVKRLRSKLADAERNAAIEADRLEAEGYAVPGDGDADVSIVIELWQGAGTS